MAHPFAWCSKKVDQDNPPSRVVSVIAFCGFGLLLALALPLWSPSGLTWLKSVTAWLHPQPSASPTSETVPTISTWSDAEIRAGLMQCVQAVAPISADLTPVAPLKAGECGTPTPILLRSINIQDKVTFDPPLLTNCSMVAALHRWLKETVQPAAKEAFGSPVIQIIGASYACRNVNNEPNGRLSQHAFANAVDLSIFVLANGQKIDVTHGWGPTARDLVPVAQTSTAVKETSSPNPSSKKASTDPIKVSTARTPKDVEKTAVTTDAADHANSAKFLRLSVQGACAIFSTALGPEFNAVHRTHLHLDLQDRGASNVCK